MASRFWTFVTNMAAGQTARAEQVNGQLSAIEGALALVATEMNRAVRFTDGSPAEADFQLAQTPAQRSNLLLGFNAAGTAVELKSGVFVWRGDWVATTLYNVNDMVRAPLANNLSLYVCTAQHIASVFATDLAASRWAIAVDLAQVERAIKKFSIVTSSQALTAGQDVFVDTTGGAVILTLPASPSILDQPIHVCHVAGSNNILIERNGQRIMGLLEDMTVNVLTTPNAAFELAFCDAARGWRLVKGT